MPSLDGGKHSSKCKWFKLVSIDIKRFNLSIFVYIMLALIVLSSITKKGEIVRNMTPFRPLFVILVIEWQHNQWD